MHSNPSEYFKNNIICSAFNLKLLCYCASKLLILNCKTKSFSNLLLPFFFFILAWRKFVKSSDNSASFTLLRFSRAYSAFVNPVKAFSLIMLVKESRLATC